MKARSLILTVATAVALAILPAGLAAAFPPPHPLAPGPGRLSLEFQPVRKASENKGKAVWNDGFLRRGMEKLNERLTLPYDVKIVVQPGQSRDAPANPHEPLFLGYHNPEELRPFFNYWGLLTPAGRKVKPAKTAAGRRQIEHAETEICHALAFHEVGHVYTEEWPIPTTSDNEQIADLFSIWVTVKLLHDPQAVLGLANYRLGLAYFLTLQGDLGSAAWQRGQAYADLARLAAADPSWKSKVQRLLPTKYLYKAGYASFIGGPFVGLEDALAPIAQVPLGSSS